MIGNYGRKGGERYQNTGESHILGVQVCLITVQRNTLDITYIHEQS